jgi:DNA-directed RNA polymerase beta subunit
MSKKTDKTTGLTSNGRINFSKITQPYEYPNLLDIQVKSFKNSYNWKQHQTNVKRRFVESVCKKIFQLLIQETYSC